MRRALLRRVDVQLSAQHRGVALSGCVSCVSAAAYAHTHRHCLACVCTRDDQLRVGRTNDSDPRDQQWSAVALQQSRNTGADAFAGASAVAIPVADTIAFAGDRHRRGSSHGDAESSPIQRPADYRHRELRDETEHLVLRSASERDWRSRCDRYAASRHIRRLGRLSDKSEFADCRKRHDDRPHALVQHGCNRAHGADDVQRNGCERENVDCHRSARAPER